MITARKALIRFAILAATCAALFGAYSYYFTDTLTTLNNSNWTANGTGLVMNSGGMTDASSIGSSLIS